MLGLHLNSKYMSIVPARWKKKKTNFQSAVTCVRVFSGGLPIICYLDNLAISDQAEQVLKYYETCKLHYIYLQILF